MTSPQRKRRNDMKESKLQAPASKLRCVLELRRESGAMTHRTPKALRAKCVKRESSFAKLWECARVLASLFKRQQIYNVTFIPSYAMLTSTPRSEAMSRSFAKILRSSPVTISEPQ